MGALLPMALWGVAGCSSPGAIQAADSRAAAPPLPATSSAENAESSGAPALGGPSPGEQGAAAPTAGLELEEEPSGAVQLAEEARPPTAKAGSEEQAEPEEAPPSDTEPPPVEGEGPEIETDLPLDSPTCALEVIATSVEIGGRYEPRNVGAVWVADDLGQFVKTLEVWGNRRLRHVEAWRDTTAEAGVPDNDVDALTSATLRTHGEHTLSWDCRDYEGQFVPDGEYRVYFEQTESNRAGPTHFEPFRKGPEAVRVLASSAGFADIAIEFTP